MNYIDLILFVFVALMCVYGIFKGFLLTVLQFGSTIGGGILAKIFAGPVSSFIYRHFIEESVTEKLFEIMPSGSVSGELQSWLDKALSSIPSGVVKVAESFGLIPDVTETFTAGNEITVGFIRVNYIEPLITGVLKVVSVVILFVIFFVFLRIVCYIINKILTDRKKHNIIDSTNKILGGVFGALAGIVPALLIAAALTFLASYIESEGFISAVEGSFVCRLVANLF